MRIDDGELYPRFHVLLRICTVADKHDLTPLRNHVIDKSWHWKEAGISPDTTAVIGIIEVEMVYASLAQRLYYVSSCCGGF